MLVLDRPPRLPPITAITAIPAIVSLYVYIPIFLILGTSLHNYFFHALEAGP
jgi:hypothetical protein